MSREDFRQETKVFIEKLNMTDTEIAAKLRTSVRTVNRWRAGISSPLPNQFEALRQLASGYSGQMSVDQFKINPEKPDLQTDLPLELDEALKTITRIQAVLDHEVSQRSKLQDDVAVLRHELEKLKGDGEKKRWELESQFAYTIRTEIEKLRSDFAGEREKKVG